MDENAWRRCSSCKADIPFEALYWVCSVSTCNSKRRGLFFCSVDCWEIHLPIMRHRSSSAVERRSPSRASHQASQPKQSKRVASSGRPGEQAPNLTGEFSEPPKEVLIVASRLTDFIEADYGLRVTQSALHALSAKVRRLADGAITRAGFDGRKTIMDRDFSRAGRASGGPVLIIASRFKTYVKAASGMNTSGSVIDLLSDHVRAWTRPAAQFAADAGRDRLVELDFDHSE